MNRHLVSVEVRVEGGTNEWVNLDRVTFNQDRHKGLNTESVQGRSTVQKNVLALDHLFENRPYLWNIFIDESSCAADVVCQLSLEEL